MERLALSSNALARAIRVTPARINEIVRGRRGGGGLGLGASALDDCLSLSAKSGNASFEYGRKRRVCFESPCPVAVDPTYDIDQVLMVSVEFPVPNRLVFERALPRLRIDSKSGPFGVTITGGGKLVGV